MKKIITLGLVLFMILFTACNNAGDVDKSPLLIKIHNKSYKLVNVVPENNSHGIWIMYPVDSTDEQPTVMNFDVQEGKTTANQAVIILK